MNEGEVVGFLKALGCERIRVGRAGKWVSAPCPLASWDHPKGRDANPSFSMSIGDASRCKCFTCKFNGFPSELLWKLKHYGVAQSISIDQIKAEETAGSLASIRERLQQDYSPPAPVDVGGIKLPPKLLNGSVPTLLPEEHLAPLLSLSERATRYLTARSISAESIKLWELGWHEKAKRIVLPVRDYDKRLVGITGRSVLPDAKPKYLHSLGFKRDLYLYGEHLLEPGTEVGYLVEGFFDAIWLRQNGYRNPVAMLGSYLSRAQVEKLVQFFSSVVVVPDGDQPGFEAAERAERQLSPRMHVRVAAMPQGPDPAELSPQQLASILG